MVPAVNLVRKYIGLDAVKLVSIYCVLAHLRYHQSHSNGERGIVGGLCVQERS